MRANMHAADPELREWIRLHLYGDLYSSPGLDMRQGSHPLSQVWMRP